MAERCQPTSHTMGSKQEMAYSIVRLAISVMDLKNTPPQIIPYTTLLFIIQNTDSLHISLNNGTPVLYVTGVCNDNY